MQAVGTIESLMAMPRVSAAPMQDGIGFRSHTGSPGGGQDLHSWLSGSRRGGILPVFR